MNRSKSQVITVCVALAAVGTVLWYRGISASATPPHQNALRPPISDNSPALSAGTPQQVAAVELPETATNWAKEYDTTNDYFGFVSKAARSAFDGNGSAAVYISKALYLCLPIARHYGHSDNPEADFTAFWAEKTHAPQWVLDGARKDFHLCRGFVKGDAFASLPPRDGGYYSSEYWMDQAAANNDPVALSLRAGSDIGDTFDQKSAARNQQSLESAQAKINNAVASKSAAALFQVGQLLSDGHASSDRLQGFAVSIAACDLGYDCTTDNAALFGACADAGLCTKGTTYADMIKKVVGENGYTQAYARAQQFEDALARGDTTAIHEFVKLKPTL